MTAITWRPTLEAAALLAVAAVGYLLAATRIGCWTLGHLPPAAGVWTRQLMNGYRCARCRGFVAWGRR
jgi:hypothetical protein